ncbi:MAG TPA: SagB/ThcOx family dehydrogenase [bacterium]|nr:SagB/ThcOx family dehydrogenase [bacterium]
MRVSRLGLVSGILVGGMAMVQNNGLAKDITLPSPSHSSRISVEAALQQRRSLREYSSVPVTLAELSQLLWAAQGITSRHGYRAAPSAGALFPLEVYLVAGHVIDLPAGVYRYRPHAHTLAPVAKGDLRSKLSSAALGQSSIRDGAAVLVLTAVYERTTAKYGSRGVQYVHMEVGHAAQNVYLQAVSLELGTVFIGAFYDDRVKDLLKLPDSENPLGIMPLGRLNQEQK